MPSVPRVTADELSREMESLTVEGRREAEADLRSLNDPGGVLSRTYCLGGLVERLTSSVTNEIMKIPASDFRIFCLRR